MLHFSKRQHKPQQNTVIKQCEEVKWFPCFSYKKSPVVPVCFLFSNFSTSCPNFQSIKILSAKYKNNFTVLFFLIEYKLLMKKICHKYFFFKELIQIINEKKNGNVWENHSFLNFYKLWSSQCTMFTPPITILGSIACGTNTASHA